MKRMNIKAAIWDLDGTLLNTLDDLAASTNAALAANGLPRCGCLSATASAS